MEIRFTNAEARVIEDVLIDLYKEDVFDHASFKARHDSLKSHKTIDLIVPRWRIIASSLKERARLRQISGEDSNDEKLMDEASFLYKLADKINKGGR